MLTNADNKLNFLIFQACSKLGIFPIKFGHFEQGARVEKGIGRRILFKFWQALTCSHMAYLVSRTGYAALFGHPDWLILPLMISLILCFGTFVLFMYFLFESQLGLTVMVFNEILGIRDELVGSSQSSKKRRTAIELLLCHSFTLLSSGLGIYPILYFLDMDAMYLQISMVPASWRYPPVIAIFLVMEIIPHIVYLMWLNFAMYMIISFVLTFNQLTTSAFQKLQKRTTLTEYEETFVESVETSLKEAFKTVGIVNLYLKFFNLAASQVLFLAKQLCLIVAIAGGFLAILIVKEKPPVAFMYYLLHLYTTTFYIGMFSLAYGVTTNGEELKWAMLVQSKDLASPADRLLCKKRIRAMPTFAMSVGGFNTVERESVPVFVDFVFQQIVGLLITFKG